MQFKIVMDDMKWLVADQPEQRKDFESGALRTSDDGRPLYQVRLLVMDGAGSAPIRVGLIGDPGLTQGQFVKPVGLVLNAIDRKGDSVMWWTAEALEVAAMPGGEAPAGGSGKGSAK